MAFANEARNEVWLALRQDGASGDGSPQNPYDASSPTLFADRMNSFLPGTKIHLGPGIFQSPAFDPAKAPPAIWQAKSGWSIEAAGRFVTTIKVVGATSQTQESSGVGNSGFISGFSISNLSIDCNMRGHLGTGVCIGAITVYGTKTKVRRVRAIDFGTEGPSAGVECFVIGIAGAHPAEPEAFDCIVQDCLIEKPYKNGLYNSSCLIFFAGEAFYPDGVMAYTRSCVMRKNLFNCEYQDNPIPIASITVSGTVATATTKIPHGREVNQWVVISGALENSQPSIHFNGSFLITNVSNATSLDFTYFPATGASNPPTPAAGAATGDMWLGKYSSDIVGIKYRVPPSPYPETDPYNPGEQGVTVDTTTNPGKWTVTLVTDRPHRRVPGDNVWVRVVTVNTGQLSPILNHLFPISAVINPAKLQFVVSSNPGSPDAVQDGSVQINPTQVCLSADAGIGSIVENNRVYNARGGCYHDAWSTKDLTIRKNQFVAVSSGIYHNMQGGTPRVGSPLIHNLTTAILTSNKVLNLPSTPTVAIQAGVIYDFNNPPYYPPTYNNPYNRTAAATPDATLPVFQYSMSPDPDPGQNARGWPVFAPVLDGTIVRDPSNHTIAKFTTANTFDHGYKVGEFVAVSGATESQYNGSFGVLSISTVAPFWFTYQMSSDPGGDATGTPKCNKTGTPAQSLSVFSRITNQPVVAIFTTAQPHGLSIGELVSIFGATISNASVSNSIANPFNGAFSISSISVVSPYSFNYQMLADPGTDPDGASAPFCMRANSTPLTRNGSIATFTTPSPHGLEAGQGIIISGAGAPYDGGFSTKSIPSPKTLSYELGTTPLDNAAPPATLLTPWQTGRQIVQRNMIDLILTSLKSGWGFSEAIVLSGGTQIPPYFFPEAILRGNIIRSLENASQAGSQLYGIVVRSCEEGIVERNIVQLTNPTPVVFDFSGRVKFFSNQTPDGIPIQGILSGTSQASNELTTDAQLALSLLT